MMYTHGFLVLKTVFLCLFVYQGSCFGAHHNNTSECPTPSPCRACMEISRLQKMCMMKDSLCSNGNETERKFITKQRSNCCNNRALSDPLTFRCLHTDSKGGMYGDVESMYNVLNGSLHNLLKSATTIDVSASVAIIKTMLRNLTSTSMMKDDEMKFASESLRKLNSFTGLQSCRMKEKQKNNMTVSPADDQAAGTSNDMMHCAILHGLIKFFTSLTTNGSCNELPTEFRCKPGLRFCFALESCVNVNGTCQFAFERMHDKNTSMYHLSERCQQLSPFCKRFNANLPKYKKICPKLDTKGPSHLEMKCDKHKNNKVCRKMVRMHNVCAHSKVVCFNKSQIKIPKSTCCGNSSSLDPLTFSCKNKQFENGIKLVEVLNRALERFNKIQTEDISGDVSKLITNTLNMVKEANDEDKLSEIQDNFVAHMLVISSACQVTATNSVLKNLGRGNTQSQVNTNKDTDVKPSDTLCSFLHSLIDEISLQEEEKIELPDKYKCPDKQKFCFTTGKCIAEESSCGFNIVTTMEIKNATGLWKVACTVLPKFCNESFQVYKDDLMDICSAEPIISGDITVLLQEGRTLQNSILMELYYLKYLSDRVSIEEIKRIHGKSDMHFNCDTTRRDKEYVFVRHECIFRATQKRFCDYHIWYGLAVLSNGKIYKVKFIHFNLKFPPPSLRHLPVVNIPEWITSVSNSKYAVKFIELQKLNFTSAPSTDKCYSVPEELLNLVKKRNDFKLCRNPVLHITLCKAPSKGTFILMNKRQQLRKLQCNQINSNPVQVMDLQSIAYHPPSNSEQLAYLRFSFMCLVMTTKSELRKIIADTTSETNDEATAIESPYSDLQFHVMPANSPPDMHDKIVFGSPISQDLSKNTGISLSTIMNVQPRLYGPGYSSDHVVLARYQPFISDPDGPIKKGGVLVINVKNSGKVGSFTFKCENHETWQSMEEVSSTKALLLTKDCYLKFNPVYIEQKSNYREAYLEIYAWDGSNELESGFYGNIDLKSDAYSRTKAKLYVLQFGCDGVADSAKIINDCDECSDKPCEKKCDGEFKSNAAEDSCGVCYGGTTGVLKNSRRYRNQNGRFACCKQDLDCYQCPDDGPVRKDCNNQCLTSKPAYKRCDTCVSGTTGLKEMDVYNSCGQCKNNVTISETCNSGYISSVHPVIMHDSAPIKQFQICFSTMYKDLVCRLYNSGGVCDLESYEKTKIEKHMSGCYSVLFHYRKENCLSRYLFNSCKAGSYNLLCSNSDVTVNYTKLIKIEQSNKIIVTKISPDVLNAGKITLLTAMGDFAENGKYFCHFEKQNWMKVVQSRHNATHLWCNIYLDKVETGLTLAIKDCKNRKSDPTSLTTTCDEPTIVMTKTSRWAGHSILVHFNAAFNINKDKDCENLNWRTRNIMGIRLNQDEINAEWYCLKRKCFGCPGVVLSDRPGCTDVKLPKLPCSIHGADLINTCENLKLSPVMKNLEHANWTAINVDQIVSSEVLKEKLTIRGSGRLWMKNDKDTWSVEGRKYKVNMCGLTKYGGRCCSSKNVTVAPAKTLKCEIGGIYQSKTFIIIKPKMKTCNSLINVLHKWIVKGNGVSDIITPHDPVLRIPKNAEVMKFNWLDIQLRGSMQSNVTCTTSVRKLQIGKPLTSTLAGGRKTLYANCDDEVVRIFSKISHQPLKSDEILWTCYPIVDGVQSADKCVDNTTGTDLVFDNKRLIIINAAAQLNCGGEYNISLAYTRNETTIYQSVKLIVADLHCPVISCRKKEDKDMFRIMCNVDRALKENVTFTNFIDDADSGLMDFDQAKRSIYINQLKPKKQGNYLIDMVRITAIIKKEMLTKDTKYRFDVNAANDDCTASTESIELIHYAAPSNCNVSAVPNKGVAFNTSFEVYADGCDDAEDAKLEYQAGVKINGKFKAAPFGSSNSIFLHKLPRGDPKRGDELDIIVKVRNLHGMVSAFSTTVIVSPPDKTDDEILRENNNEIEKSVEEGDFIAAASQIAQVVSGVINQQIERNIERMEGKDNFTECITLSPEAQMLQDETAEIVITMHNQHNVQSEETEKAVSSLTEKVCPEDISSKVIKKMANLAFEKFVPIRKQKNDTSEEDSRKRRSIENHEEKEVEEEETEEEFLETSSIDTFVTTSSNNLFPIMYDEEEDAVGRQLLIERLPWMKRSLSANLDGYQNLTITSDNIVLYTETINTIVPNMNIHMPLKERVMFTNTMKDSFYVWQCTENGDYCNGFTITASTIKGDIFSSSPSSNKLVSNIFGLYLVNPHSDELSSFIDVPKVNESLKITVPLTAANLTGDVKCYMWDVSSWSSELCTTQLQVSEAVCVCSKLGHIAVFETPDNYYTFMKKFEKEEGVSTTSRPTTVNGTVSSNMKTSSSGHSTSSSNSETGSTSQTTGSTSQTIKKSSLATPETTTRNRVLKTKQCEFAFDADFTIIVNKFGNQDIAREQICTQVREYFKFTTVEFSGCSIRKGSVIVVFTLTQNESTLNDTLKKVALSVQDGTIVMKTPDGEKLFTVTSSFMVDDKKYEIMNQSKEKDDDGNTVIILTVVIVILLLGIVVALVLYFCKRKKKHQQVDPYPKTDHTMMEPPPPYQSSDGMEVEAIPSRKTDSVGSGNPTFEANDQF